MISKSVTLFFDVDYGSIISLICVLLSFSLVMSRLCSVWEVVIWHDCADFAIMRLIGMNWKAEIGLCDLRIANLGSMGSFQRSHLTHVQNTTWAIPRLLLLRNPVELVLAHTNALTMVPFLFSLALRTITEDTVTWENSAFAEAARDHFRSVWLVINAVNMVWLGVSLVWLQVLRGLNGLIWQLIRRHVDDFSKF